MSIQSTILLFLLPLSLHAQLEKMINHKDISWAAEVEAAIGFDIIDNSSPTQLLEAVPVKAVQENPEAPRLQPFTQKLNDLIAQGAFPAFADKNLQRPLTAAKARSRLVVTDTIVVFDPETYEEKIHIVSNDLLGATAYFITRQLWLYNDRTNELETVALAIAPALESKEKPGQYKPLVWYKLPAPRKSLFKMKSSAVPFVTYVRYDVSEEQIKVLKGKEKHLKEILIERFKGGNIKGYDQKRNPILSSTIEDVFVQQDTIITFDPETYEEKVQVVRLEFGPLDIKDFRVQQNWFFAPSRPSLQCRPVAAAPAIPVIDEDGAQVKLRPLFFWRKE